MKTVCLLLTKQDKVWAKQLKLNTTSNDYVFIAPTFEGGQVARELGYKYNDCENIVRNLNKTSVHDDARKMAFEWFQLGELRTNINLVKINNFDVSAQPFLKKILIDEWRNLGLPFQNFLIQQGLSSNMWVIARKPLS